MKTIYIFIAFFISISVGPSIPKAKVFIFTDINLVGGDPDDRQSLIHLLWYSDELDIVGIVPDRWNGKGYEACQLALEAYEKDYIKYDFETKGFPSPLKIMEKIIGSEEEAIKKLREEVQNSPDPIYVLVWGNMRTIKKALFNYPEVAPKIRMLTIGTGLKFGPKDEVAGDECDIVNWNGQGRNDIYNDVRFDSIWWLESNWTYNGMFSGSGPKEMFGKLSTYGDMGEHIKDVTKDHDWAQYFRVGDTPSVTYLLDKDHDSAHPTISSWAGKFKKPFPAQRPNYYTDDNGSIEWNYSEPCATWENSVQMYEYNKSTLVHERQEMYDQLLFKLNRIYGR